MTTVIITGSKERNKLMSFKDDLYFKTYTDKSDKLTRSFYYFDNKYGKITVPRGFITDYASVPLPLLPFFPKIGRARKAAVLHDWLYDVDCKTLLSRREADNIFLDCMSILEVRIWRRLLMYSGVRLLGFIRYKKKKKNV